ncbi:hypothetical protein BDZ89DRAFT_1070236 [Hymenopellis radicata]|nr:hypothetical protein BDZ89DRAFT_1070236 [Hymenopellis radicata]
MSTNISRAPPPACGQCAEFHSPSLPDFCSTNIYQRLANTNEPITEIFSKVQEGVDVLATRREHLRAISRMQDVLLKCRGVISPLRRVPQEILTEIFHLSCVDHTNILDTSGGPWRLGQVCRRWRNIVISTPLVMGRVYLDCIDPTSASRDIVIKDSLPILRRALALSCEIPLDIKLHMMTETLIMHTSSTNSGSKRHGTWVEEDEEMLPAIHHLQTILPACPSLTHLRMTYPYIFSLRNPEPSVRHITLRTLTISDDHLLDMLVLPCLEELHVKNPGMLTLIPGMLPSSRAMLTAIANLIARSGCSLKSLRIVDLPDAMALCAVLALTPELTELKLKYREWSQSDYYDVVLEELWPGLTFTNDSQLVPKLTASTYYMKHTIDFISKGTLCNFLDSRYRDDNGAARLKNVEILFRFDADIYNLWTRAAIKRLLELKQDGLNISICTKGGMAPLNRDGSPNLGYTVDLHDLRKVYV